MDYLVQWFSSDVYSPSSSIVCIVTVFPVNVYCVYSICCGICCAIYSLPLYVSAVMNSYMLQASQQPVTCNTSHARCVQLCSRNQRRGSSYYLLLTCAMQRAQCAEIRVWSLHVEAGFSGAMLCYVLHCCGFCCSSSLKHKRWWFTTYLYVPNECPIFWWFLPSLSVSWVVLVLVMTLPSAGTVDSGAWLRHSSQVWHRMAPVAASNQPQPHS